MTDHDPLYRRQVRDTVAIYGSGGFTTCSDDMLCQQFSR